MLQSWYTKSYKVFDGVTLLLQMVPLVSTPKQCYVKRLYYLHTMAFDEEKQPVGRPTKYQDTYPAQVEKLCKLGATDAEIADFFDVAESTINLWKAEHPEFSESIKAGKTLADANVAHSLYHRATGYEHPDVDIKVIEGQIVITDLVKHYPPDPTSIIFWLKNRQKDKWRDKTEMEISGVKFNVTEPDAGD